MSYQYYYSVLYWKIHLLRFIYLYCTFIYVIEAISLYFICNHHITLIFSQISNQLLCEISKLNVRVRNINLNPNKFWSPPHSKHWNTDHHHGLVNHSEGDCESDIKRLASDHLRKYTTVTNQCKKSPWTWSWHFWYCDLWSHFDNLPGKVQYFMC